MSSNMVVQTNVLALNSHRNLKTIGIKQEKASQRLSSGYRINSAADDAAGLAISEKMRAQIRGLDMASKNAQDGISLVQTAEGGMQEIDNMAQRIRELIVQASNDTNDFDTEDRTKIQEEIDQLIEEIDSMSERVEFNAKKLLNGDYADPVAQLARLNKQEGKLDTSWQAADTALTDATNAVTKAGQDVLDAGTDLSTLLGHILAGTGGYTANAVYGAYDTIETAVQGNIQDVLDGWAALEAFGAGMTGGTSDFAQDILDLYNAEYGTSLSWTGEIDASNVGAWETFFTEMAAIFDDTTPPAGPGQTKDLHDAILAAATAIDSTVTDLKDTATMTDTGAAETAANKLDNDTSAGDSFDELAAARTDWENEQIYKDEVAPAEKLVEDATAAKATADAALVTATATEADLATKLADIRADIAALDAAIQAGTAGAGGLWFQVGANSDQGIRVGINAINTLEMGIGNGDGTTNDIDVDVQDGQAISKMLDTLDEALSFISSERSRLGAVQNRLEYTMNSLDISSENLSAAESRIRDTDMAKEMMNLTKANVLQQAATSMLAQANQAPNSILQLLG